MNKRPTNIKIYDNGGQTYDRYTVVYMDQVERPAYIGKDYLGKPCYIDKAYACLGMSAEPFHPLGFGQHSSAMVGPHLGRRLAWKNLPVDCQRAVLQDFQ